MMRIVLSSCLGRRYRPPARIINPSLRYMHSESTTCGHSNEPKPCANHYQLLCRQASSFFALSQVNEKLLLWLKFDSSVLKRLLELFITSCEGHGDAQLSAADMRAAAKKWMADGSQGPPQARAFFQTSAEHLKAMMFDKELLDDDDEVSYYDFMNHMIGRRKVQVQLCRYDISDGKAWYLSPLLIGRQLEGIWHTGVVVHDKEYWFGGNIFESTPGQTPFGEPTRTTFVGYTMRTRDDLWNFVRRELTDDYTPTSYDVLTHNCNHFSDAVLGYLLNQHVDEDVLRQPELVMNTRIAQLLRPWLNSMLGRFDAEGDAGFSSLRSTDEQAAQDDWNLITPGSLVVYEYENGWTCIARVCNKEDETS